MTKYSHNFVEKYDGLIGFGLDRVTDESTVICYLQMFSDDDLMKKIIKSLSDKELEDVFMLLSNLMRNHLNESEYHKYFLKDEHRD